MTKKQFLILLFIFIPFFSKEKNTSLKTNVKYEIKSPSFRLMGDLYFDFHHKDKFVKN